MKLLAADAVGIMISDDQHRLRVVASTNEQSDWMELLQLEADEGPCMDCYRTGTAVSVADLKTAAQRWPRFVPALAQRGAYGSVHALPLHLRGEAIGTLNLFHNEPGPLPPADLALGQAMADVATIGILSEQAINRAEVLSGQLQTALDKRIVIEQAKGVLAERGRLSMDEAFDRLRRYARNNNQRLSDLAAKVVTTPAPPPTRCCQHRRPVLHVGGDVPASGQRCGSPWRSSSSSPTGHAPSQSGGTTATGQVAWCRRASPTEPSTSPRNCLRRRDPTTSSAAPTAASSSVAAGWCIRTISWITRSGYLSRHSCTWSASHRR